MRDLLLGPGKDFTEKKSGSFNERAEWEQVEKAKGAGKRWDDSWGRGWGRGRKMDFGGSRGHVLRCQGVNAARGRTLSRDYRYTFNNKRVRRRTRWTARNRSTMNSLPLNLRFSTGTLCIYLFVRRRCF